MQDLTQQARQYYYENLVDLKFQVFNSLFLTLPLDAVEQAGLLLPLLEEASHEGLEQGLDPTEILERFFQTHRPQLDERKRAAFLFKVIQYVERQVVLLDALEDAAFAEIHQTEETDRLRKLVERVEGDRLQDKFRQLLHSFNARVTLTAHPTQFYPGPVLGIITDLTAAVQSNDIAQARQLLQQLGNTPFFKKEKPTPSEEANQLCWYLSNIFYPAVGEILDTLSGMVGTDVGREHRLLSVGFWPGGDRDGNPFVTSAITLEVAENLRFRILECYRRDLRRLKRRLSFAGIHDRLEAIEKRIHAEITRQIPACFDSVGELESSLAQIDRELRERFQGLYVEQLDSFRRKLAAFGFYFAMLDIRQDSRVIAGLVETLLAQRPELFPENFAQLGEARQLEVLLTLEGAVAPSDLEDPLHRDTLESLLAMGTIQRRNGELGCHRYIISNTRGPRDVANIIALFRLSGWRDRFSVDVVPLFETIDDLRQAGAHMARLYDSAAYRQHLACRGNRQTVMLGFSDGTKDGGYLMANWAIYRAKEDLTRVSRERGVEVVFFDGRGGPPARGGGSAYKFFAALGRNIESNEIQLTVQGQTVSSYYGTRVAARHNLRQLTAAGLDNNLYERPRRELTGEQRSLIEELAAIAYDKYLAFRAHPQFLPYLEQMSPLNYYAQSNIGSRPAKRGSQSGLKFEDLRAIPFVGAWAQLKQNVPGYFGLGTALKELQRQGRLEQCQALYRDSGFFEALIGNSMQSMKKSNFKLTAYMAEDPVFGEFWKLLNDEFELSREMALKVSGQTVMLEDNATSRYSIALRQRVVLPLLIIQQHAIMKLNSLAEQAAEDAAAETLYEKMIVRSLFGNINASRNSA